MKRTFRFLVLFFAVLPVALAFLLLFFRVVPFVFLSLLRLLPSRGDRRIPDPDTPLMPPPPRDQRSFPFRLTLLSRESSLRLSRSRSRRERESWPWSVSRKPPPRRPPFFSFLLRLTDEYESPSDCLLLPPYPTTSGTLPDLGEL